MLLHLSLKIIQASLVVLISCTCICKLCGMYQSGMFSFAVGIGMKEIILDMLALAYVCLQMQEVWTLSFL